MIWWNKYFSDIRHPVIDDVAWKDSLGMLQYNSITHDYQNICKYLVPKKSDYSLYVNKVSTL